MKLFVALSATLVVALVLVSFLPAGTGALELGRTTSAESTPASFDHILGRGTAEDPTSLAEGSASAAPAKIAYRDSRPGGGWDLIVMREDGSGKSVVYSGGSPCCISWSPEGHSLAFQDNGVWRVDVSVAGEKFVGSNLVQLAANDQARLPAWSPLGDEIAVVADPYGSPSIAVIPPTGGSLQILYAPPPGSGVEFPTWRFDGTRIAFKETDVAGVRAIRILDRATLTISASYVPDVTDIMWLHWARTKDVLAFSDATDKFPGVGQDVFTLDLTSGALTLVVMEARVPSWSPGDGELVYAKNNKFRRSIVVLDFASGTTKTLAKSGDFPSWSRA